MNISKKWYILVVIIVIIVGITSGYVYYTKNEDSAYNEYHFELEMESENQTTVYWPIPYDSYNEGDESYGNLSELVYDLKIVEGEGSIEVDETQYGKALKIEFKESITIKGNKVLHSDNDNHREIWHNYNFDDLTMRNKTKHSNELYFVYSSNDDTTIVNFNCYSEYVGELDSNRTVGLYIEDFTLKEGWQSVEFSGGVPKYEEPED